MERSGVPHATPADIARADPRPFDVVAARGPAQVASTPVLVARLDSAEGAVPAGASVLLQGEIEYSSDALSPYLQSSGVRVTLSVVEAPEWASVVLSPQEVVLHPSLVPHGATWMAAELFQAHVHVADGAPAGEHAQVVIEARTAGGPLVSSASSQAAAVVAAAAAGDACHHPEEDPAAQSDGLTTQSAAAAPAAGPALWAAGGVGAVAAAGAALLLRRRLRG